MKKVLLSLVFVLATGSLLNASVHNGELVTFTSNENIEIVKKPHFASDCVRWAKGLVFEFADRNNENPNDYQFYMDVYMRYYTGCLKGC